MKHFKKVLLSLLVPIQCLCSGSVVLAEEKPDIMEMTWQYGYAIPEIYRPKAAFVMNADTGEILYDLNSDLVRDPASMTKVMTLYLLFEDIYKGKLSLDTYITATETDQAISRILSISNNDLYAGIAYPVSDLITMTLMSSSNAATLMLANYISDNDASAFIDRMNRTAKKLGMTQTIFYNATGAIASSFNGYYQPKKYNLYAHNETTAHDLGLLTYHFLKKYPDILAYSSILDAVTMPGTAYEQHFHSYNHSLPGGRYGLEGVDGLKTGSSPSAAFNNIVTAKRGDIRLISVIMGVGSWDDLDNSDLNRNAITNALLENMFIKAEALAKEEANKKAKVTVSKKNTRQTASTTTDTRNNLPNSSYKMSKRFNRFVEDFGSFYMAVFIITACGALGIALKKKSR